MVRAGVSAPTRGIWDRRCSLFSKFPSFLFGIYWCRDWRRENGAFMNFMTVVSILAIPGGGR